MDQSSRSSRAFLLAPLLECVEFGDSALELLGGIEFCGQKRTNKFAHECPSHDLSTEAQYVGIIVLDALVRRICVMSKGGPDTLHFVGCHAGPDTGTANKDPTFSLSVKN